MRYDNEPLGCFQKVLYGLIGVGVYLLVGVCCLISGTVIVLQLTPTPDPRQEYDLLGGFLVATVIPAIGFLCAGPLMVVAYIFYLEDLQMIKLPTSLSLPISLRTRDKFKNGSPIEE